MVDCPYSVGQLPKYRVAGEIDSMMKPRTPPWPRLFALDVLDCPHCGASE